MTSSAGATTVVVLGQGYVGLPLAIAAARAGHTVVGVDRDGQRISELLAGNAGDLGITDDDLRACLDAGRYRPSSDLNDVAAADVVVICVPTPYRNEAPDLSLVEAAIREVGVLVTRGTLVVLESTTYPGTTEELVQPLLTNASGLSPEDLDIAFSPERIDPGNSSYDIRNTPKIVGGMTTRATERACSFYATFVERVVPVSSAKTAEMAKLLENTFRHINIALVNELAVLCQGLDVDIWEVIEAAATKPFGFMPFYPGPGVGGHCIPIDPMYLSWRVRQFGGAARFIELARDVNAAMPAYCASRVQDLLNERGLPLRGAAILVLGVTYKPGVADMRESPALPFIAALRSKGADVRYHDPYIPRLVLSDGAQLDRVELDEASISSADCVVVVTAHERVPYEAVVRAGGLVFDTRHAAPDGPNVHRL